MAGLPDEGVGTSLSEVARSGGTTTSRSTGQHYSVPRTLAGQLLWGTADQHPGHVFDGQQIVAEHTRRHGRKG